MRKAYQEGNYKEMASEAGKQIGEAYQSASQVVTTKMQELSQTDFSGVHSQVLQKVTSAYQGAVNLGMTLYSKMPSKESVMKTAGDFYEEMYGHDGVNPSSENNSQPRI